MLMKFVVTLDVRPEAYVGDTTTTASESDVARCIAAGLYKTYADPAREDAGILSVLSVAPAEHHTFEHGTYLKPGKRLD